jgi:hypothetical protein
MSYLESAHPESRWWMMPLTLFTALFTVLMPIFYFALFRSEGSIRTTKSLRLVALAGSLCVGLFVASGLPAVIESFKRNPRTIDSVSLVFAEASNLFSILLLVALFRLKDDDSARTVPMSRMFRLATKITVTAWGLALVLRVLGLILVPFTYFQLRNYALQAGRISPPFGNLLREAIVGVISSAGLFAAPYILYRSQKRNGEKIVGDYTPDTSLGTHLDV